MGYPVAMNLPDNAGGTETQVQILGLEDPLKKEMATHSSNLAWKIPWTEEPGGVTQSQTRLKRLSTQHTMPLDPVYLPGLTQLTFQDLVQSRSRK